MGKNKRNQHKTKYKWNEYEPINMYKEHTSWFRRGKELKRWD